MSESRRLEEEGSTARSELALMSLLAGLLSILVYQIFVFGILAILLGVLSARRKRASPLDRTSRTMAIGGIILGFFSSVVVIFDSPTASLVKAKQVTSLATATALESAIDNLYNEYGKLPGVGNCVTTNTPEGLKMLNILLGIDDKSDHSLNSRAIKFLSVKEGKNHKNGLIYSADSKSVEGLYDPWGNPYTVILDTEYKEHLHFSIGSNTVDLKGRRSAAFSPGPDKQIGTADDVTTW